MKAISVFSGGLDSILASILIKALDIEVQGLFFETPFFPLKRQWNPPNLLICR